MNEMSIYGPLKVEDDVDVISMVMKANLYGFMEALAESDEETERYREKMNIIVAAVKAYLETR